jgi:hypothetical protein
MINLIERFFEGKDLDKKESKAATKTSWYKTFYAKPWDRLRTFGSFGVALLHRKDVH